MHSRPERRLDSCGTNGDHFAGTIRAEQTMRLGSSGVGLAIIIVACAGCSPDTTDGAANRSVAAVREGKSGPGPARNVARGSGTTAEEVLRFPDPGEGPWKKWLTYSESEDGEEKYKSYRIPGDSFSRYYDVEADMSQGDQNTVIRNDKGEYLKANFYRYADYIGIRKTSNNVIVFAYYLPDDEETIGNYNVARIQGGSVTMYWCTVSRSTLNQVATEHFSTQARLGTARFEYAPSIIDLLTSAEPDLKRDECE